MPQHELLRSQLAQDAEDLRVAEDRLLNAESDEDRRVYRDIILFLRKRIRRVEQALPQKKIG